MPQAFDTGIVSASPDQTGESSVGLPVTHPFHGSVSTMVLL